MTDRAFQIDKAVLAYLESIEGAPALEAIIHGAVGGMFQKQSQPRPSLQEMDQSFARLNSKRQVIGLPSAVKGSMKWTITDAGRAVLIQMNDE